jgi:hypothetical protein
MFNGLLFRNHSIVIVLIMIIQYRNSNSTNSDSNAMLCASQNTSVSNTYLYILLEEEKNRMSIVNIIRTNVEQKKEIKHSFAEDTLEI